MGREKSMAISLDTEDFVMRKERNEMVAGGENEAQRKFTVFKIIIVLS